MYRPVTSRLAIAGLPVLLLAACSGQGGEGDDATPAGGEGDQPPPIAGTAIGEDDFPPIVVDPGRPARADLLPMVQDSQSDANICRVFSAIPLRIFNLNTGDAGEFKVALYLDENKIDEVTVGGVAAGMSEPAQFSAEGPIPAGDYNVIIVADDGNVVGESNEDNNRTGYFCIG